jgi:hypothetical protein
VAADLALRFFASGAPAAHNLVHGADPDRLRIVILLCRHGP